MTLLGIVILGTLAVAGGSSFIITTGPGQPRFDSPPTSHSTARSLENASKSLKVQNCNALLSPIPILFLGVPTLTPRFLSKNIVQYLFLQKKKYATEEREPRELTKGS